MVKKQLEARMAQEANQRCRTDVMQDVLTVMEEHSPHARAYKYMHDVEQEEERQAICENRQPRQVPTHDGIAAVFVGEDGAPPAQRDITVYPKDQPPQRISYMSCNIDPIMLLNTLPQWRCWLA